MPAAGKVVRISVEVVQVDAVVTDKKGRYVTDLTANDFEVLEDGKPQKITNFSYVRISSSSAPPVQTPLARGIPVPTPTLQLLPTQVQRTIALVIDDLGLSFESVAFVRDALKKFVREQMQAGDLAAIIRTSGGIGTLQQFTFDRSQLLASVDRVRWSPFSRAGISSFPSISGAAESGEAVDEEFRTQVYSIGTLGSLSHIVRGLSELPGRKSVVLFSEGFNIDPGSGEGSRVLDGLRRLADFANRASVLFYAIDPRGLPVLGFTAADNLSGYSPDQLPALLSSLRSRYFQSQSGLDYLSRETGGLFFHDNNDLAAGVRRAMEDQDGYYLLGYTPAPETFARDRGNAKFHQITVQVKRSELTVRSRKGFYGIEDAQRAPRARAPEVRMVDALTSPFGMGDIQLRLTSLFANSAQAGSFLRSLLYIDALDLTFVKENDGKSKAKMDILAVAFGDQDAVVGQFSRSYTISVDENDLQRVRKQGFVYTMDLRLKKGGAYQLRAAVRDASSQKIGSARQFVHVPDVNKGKLALSGIVASGFTREEWKQHMERTQGVPSEAIAAEKSAKGEAPPESKDPQATPAVRRFKRGLVMQYGVFIYNAKTDTKTGKPQVEMQSLLYRDGRPVFTGKVAVFESKTGQDMRRFPAVGALTLGQDLIPGDYVLQVVVTDKLAHKHNMANQWIDFQIVP